MSEFRTLATAIVADLQANVAQLATNLSIHYSEPIAYPADAPHLAIFLAGDRMGAPSQGQAMAGPTGARNFEETYRIRYWEPAEMDTENNWVDDDAMNTLENLYIAVQARFLPQANWAPAGTGRWRVWYLNGRTLIGGRDDIGFSRGFEMDLAAQVFRQTP